MATIEELGAALQKADAAGDAVGAKVLADAIRGMQGQPQAVEPSTLDKVGNFVKKYIAEPALGGLETATSLTTGALAAPVALGAGVAGMMLPGPSGQGADYMNRVMEAGTYKPQTGVGQVATDVGTYIPRKIGEGAQAAGEKVADVTGSPTAGAITQSTLQVAPALVGRGLATAKPIVDNIVANRQAAANSVASRSLPKNETWAAARQEGYVVPPSAVNSTAAGNFVEGIGGKAAIKQQAALSNQEVTNKIARREAGVGPDEALTSESLQVARDTMAAPYRAVARVSPTAAQALEDLQTSRAESKIQWNHYNRTGVPDAYRNATAADVESRRLEAVIDSEARNAGDPDLLSQVRQARVNIAKNLAVDKALNDANGNVDARVIGKMFKSGKPLSDGLETIGRFAQAFYPYVTEESRVPAPGVSKLNGVTGVAGALAGNAMAGKAGTLLGLLPYVSGPARSLALSNYMQPSTGLRPYSPSLGLRAGVNLTDQGITDPAAIFAITEQQRKGLRQ